MIVTRNAATMPQERWNTQWVRDEGLGIVLPSFTRVRSGVEAMLAELPMWRERVTRYTNQAVFEVPRVLADLLASAHSNDADTTKAT